MDSADADEREQVPVLCRVSPVCGAGETVLGIFAPELHWWSRGCGLAEVHARRESAISRPDGAGKENARLGRQQARL